MGKQSRHILQTDKGDIDYNTFYARKFRLQYFISGSAQPKLTIEALSSMRVIVPPKDEQRNSQLFEKNAPQPLTNLSKT